MKLVFKPTLALLLLALGGLFTGCTTRTNKDSSIPWSRPADWEGQIPGLSQPGQGGR
ncbi:MAG: hypothetical protein KA257_05255 [Opitutaceae bacterium]|nr:hypothetical protein [Opitutaceae bacterium]MBP9912921.1 hypothetical protein [Opitutaceae bacterium]